MLHKILSKKKTEKDKSIVSEKDRKEPKGQESETQFSMEEKTKQES